VDAPTTFVLSFIFVMFTVNFASARFYLNHRRAEPAWAETNPTIAQDSAATCARADVTFQNCFAPLPELGHPGLCLFSAPVTKDSTLSVKLDTLSTCAIKQRLADWACLMSRPPVFTNRCHERVSDQVSILFGSTSVESRQLIGLS